MTLKDSWSHFIFHICKCLLEFATRGKHDVRALDVFLGAQRLRSGSFAFQGDTECSEAVTSFTSFLCETVSLGTHFAYAFLGIVLSDAFLIEKTWYFIIMTDCFHLWKPGSFLWRHPSRLCLYRPFRPSGWRLGLCGLLRD